MPLLAVPSVKLGVTVKPPATAWSSVAVKVIASPSSADASAIVSDAASSSRIVPVAMSVAITTAFADGGPSTSRRTVKVSSASPTASSVVGTVKVCVSPLLP